MILREYQSNAADGIMTEFDSNNSTLAVMPTGTGKTILFAEIIRRFQPGRAMVLAHREELIFQAVDKIQRSTGLACAIEMAARTVESDLFKPNCPVVVSSIQTQIAGGNGGRMTKFDPMEFALVIVDESHHACAGSYLKVLEYYQRNPKLKLLGVTATPDRADEIALGEVFESVAFDYEILDAINDGYLVPIHQRMVKVESIDLANARTTAGDFNGKDLAAIMEAERPMQEVAAATVDIIGDRRTLIFTASVAQAEKLAEILNRHRSGMAEWVCGETDKENRRDILTDFSSGKTQVVCNCGVLTEGYDNPAVEVVVMARPTKSRSLYAQMIGRGTRTLPGVIDQDGQDADARKAAIAESAKPWVVVVDFVGNSGRHKLITSADILGGKSREEVVERARSKAARADGDVDMAEMLTQAEMELKQEEERRRAAVTAKARYTATVVDPFEVLAIPHHVQRGWDIGRKLSPRQIEVAQKFGVPIDGLEYHEQRQLLDECFRRIKLGLCSFKQMRTLRKFGFDPKAMSFTEAGQRITELARNGWTRKESVTV